MFKGRIEGLSAQSIVRHMTGDSNFEIRDTDGIKKNVDRPVEEHFLLKCYYAPLDADDFGRCARILLDNPLWIPRMKEMAFYRPYWSKLCQDWDMMMDLYLSSEMQKLQAHIRKIESNHAYETKILHVKNADDTFSVTQILF